MKICHENLFVSLFFFIQTADTAISLFRERSLYEMGSMSSKTNYLYNRDLQEQHCQKWINKISLELLTKCAAISPFHII